MGKLIVTIMVIFILICLTCDSLRAETVETKLYYFYSDKCAGCRIQTPIIRILKTRGFNFEIIKKSEKTQAKFDEFKVTQFPTIIIITPDETIRLEGFQPIRKLIKVLSDIK